MAAAGSVLRAHWGEMSIRPRDRSLTSALRRLPDEGWK